MLNYLSGYYEIVLILLKTDLDTDKIIISGTAFVTRELILALLILLIK